MVRPRVRASALFSWIFCVPKSHLCVGILNSRHRHQSPVLFPFQPPQTPVSRFVPLSAGSDRLTERLFSANPETQLFVLRCIWQRRRPVTHVEIAAGAACTDTGGEAKERTRTGKRKGWRGKNADLRNTSAIVSRSRLWTWSNPYVRSQKANKACR